MSICHQISVRGDVMSASVSPKSSFGDRKGRG